MAVIKVDLNNFSEEVLKSDKPVLLDMYADWCGPCMMMAPEIEAYAEETEAVKVCKLNVDDATDLATGCGRYIPRVSGDEIYLTVNTAKAGFVPAIKTVKLLPVRDESAIISSLEVGNTCFNYNDLSDGVYSRINAKTVEMGINNFVYLAFNSFSA